MNPELSRLANFLRWKYTMPPVSVYPDFYRHRDWQWATVTYSLCFN